MHERAWPEPSSNLRFRKRISANCPRESLAAFAKLSAVDLKNVRLLLLLLLVRKLEIPKVGLDSPSVHVFCFFLSCVEISEISILFSLELPENGNSFNSRVAVVASVPTRAPLNHRAKRVSM